MKQIKIFTHGSEMVLEAYVNAFAAEHPTSIIDIQYRPVGCGHAVMIVYETKLDTVHDKVNDFNEMLYDLFKGGEIE